MTYDDAAQGEISADLTAMYRAGKVNLPQRATHLSEVAQGMSSVIGSVNMRSAQLGDVPVLIDILDLAVDCQNGMSRAVTSINNMALAVVAQADEFRERDEFAQSVFNGLSQELQGEAAALPTPPNPVDKEATLAPGSNAIEANPDVQDPDQELEDRDAELELNQIFGDE